MAPAPVRRGPAPQQKLPKQRYFKGKPGADVRSDSDSDDDDDAAAVLPTRSTAPKLDAGLVAGGAGKVLKMQSSIKMDLSQAKIGDGGVKHGELPRMGHAALTSAIGEESDDESEDDEEQEAAKPSFVPKPPDDSSEYETASDEESSEEDEPPKPAFRPMFVNK